MATRHINQLFCIFDLSICKAMNLKKPLSTRAILQYDRHGNTKEIQILNNEISAEVRQRLQHWLDLNVDENIVRHLRTSEVDMDLLAAANC